jgi:hypothetical protein
VTVLLCRVVVEVTVTVEEACVEEGEANEDDEGSWEEDVTKVELEAGGLDEDRAEELGASADVPELEVAEDDVPLLLLAADVLVGATAEDEEATGPLLELLLGAADEEVGTAGDVLDDVTTGEIELDVEARVGAVWELEDDEEAMMTGVVEEAGAVGLEFEEEAGAFEEDEGAESGKEGWTVPDCSVSCDREKETGMAYLKMTMELAMSSLRTIRARH